MLLSSCSLSPGSVLGTLTIPYGSSLVFADASISLAAHSIVVAGSLVAGAPSCRLLSPINITLYGARPGPDPTLKLASLPSTTKSLLATGQGTIDLHAAQFGATWSRLASPARRGDTWLYVVDALNWDAGSTLIVATTGLKDARDHSETEEVVGTRFYALPTWGNITAIALARPLLYDHYAGVEYQAEVALLSRRMVVQGSDSDSLPSDPQPPGVVCSDASFSSFPCANASLTGFGGMVMVMGAAAAGRFSGVLLLRMGKTNVRGAGGNTQALNYVSPNKKSI